MTLNVRRYDPETKHSWAQAYQIEAGRIQRFVDLFKIINEEKDPTLAWNSSCEHGQCGTCSVKVNGKPLLAAIIRMMNPRETNKKDRKKMIYSEQGVYRCHTSRACSFVCPKEIDVAHFIALAKAGHFQDNNK